MGFVYTTVILKHFVEQDRSYLKRKTNKPVPHYIVKDTKKGMGAGIGEIKQ